MEGEHLLHQGDHGTVACDINGIGEIDSADGYILCQHLPPLGLSSSSAASTRLSPFFAGAILYIYQAIR